LKRQSTKRGNIIGEKVSKKKEKEGPQTGKGGENDKMGVKETS